MSKRTLLVAGGTMAGLATTLALAPAEALFPSATLGGGMSLGNAKPATLPQHRNNPRPAKTETPRPAKTEASRPARPAHKSPRPRASTTASSVAPAPSQSATTTAGTSGTFTGSTDIKQGFKNYGTLILQVTVDAGQITSIDFSQTTINDVHSRQLNTEALPQLASAALTAQSADVSNVSGASYTTLAFKKALQSALVQAGL